MQTAEFFRTFLGIRNEAVARRMAAASEVRRLERGDLLIQADEEQKWCFFLLSGLFRGYFLDDSGQDISECFVSEPGDTVMSCLGLREPSPITFEALEDSEVLCVAIPEVLRLLEEEVELVRLYNALLLEALRNQWQVKLALYRYSARQRYEWFLRTYPDLFGRVTNKHIASFLGITPVTLSRLRRTLREEQVTGGEVEAG